MPEDLTIDVASVIAAKSGKRLPKWVARLVERLIHQDEINCVLRTYGHNSGREFLRNLVKHFDLELQWRHAERLPKDGRAIFVCNHPLGGIDGISISHLLAEHYGEVQYLVNDMLYYLKPLQPVFLPVNTYGRQSKEAIERIHQVLAGQEPVGTFPAGWCSRYHEGKIQDKEWKASFVNMAITHQRDIVPLHFTGQNSRHFYLLDRLRKALGIKFDFCTALLPDELFRAKGKRFELIVGEPIRWQELAESGRSPREEAERIRQLCYTLVD